MPKFLVIGRYVFFIYSADEVERAHIHVRVRASAFPTAKFWLVPVVELAYNNGFKRKEISDIRKLVVKHAQELLTKWNAEFNQNQAMDNGEIREALLRGYDKVRWLDEAKRLECHRPSILDIRFDESHMHVYLDDGRGISVPLRWYPRLYFGSPEDRANWELWCHESEDVYDVIAWETLDEHIRLESLLAGRASRESVTSIRRWLKGERLYEVYDE